jgi:glutamyl-tRNA(Gln) amidotransferase subunit E
MPGSERMYPETDIPYMRVNARDIEVPPTIEERKKRLSALGANEQQCYELLKNGYEELFERLVEEFGNPQLVLRILNNTLVELDREGMDISIIDLELLRLLMKGYKAGSYTREAVEGILRGMCEKKSFDEAAAPFMTVDPDEAKAVVSRIISDNAELISEKGIGAFKAVMGDAMKEL